MKKGGKKRVFTRTFKLDAVKLAESGKHTKAEVARKLNINENLIYKWKKSFEAEKDGSSLSIDEKEELKRLRKENTILKMEQEILKKASAYFAKEIL